MSEEKKIEKHESIKKDTSSNNSDTKRNKIGLENDEAERAKVKWKKRQ